MRGRGTSVAPLWGWAAPCGPRLACGRRACAGWSAHCWTPSHSTTRHGNAPERSTAWISGFRRVGNKTRKTEIVLATQHISTVVFPSTCFMEPLYLQIKKNKTKTLKWKRLYINKKNRRNSLLKHTHTHKSHILLPTYFTDLKKKISRLLQLLEHSLSFLKGLIKLGRRGFEKGTFHKRLPDCNWAGMYGC